MKHKLLVIMAAALLSLGSCSPAYDEGYYDEEYYKTNDVALTARNFSSDATVWFIPDKEHADSLPSVLSEWQKISVFHIDAHSSYTIMFDSNDDYLTPIDTYGKEDTLAVYVFKQDIWDSCSWNELVSGEMWSCKAKYSVADALATKGIITYPMR